MTISHFTGGNTCQPPEPVLSRAEWECRRAGVAPQFSDWTLWDRHSVHAVHAALARRVMHATPPVCHPPGQPGSTNNKSKLTEDTARAIRSRYARGDISQGALAVAFGVTQPTVSQLVLGKSWKHVPMEARDAQNSI